MVHVCQSQWDERTILRRLGGLGAGRAGQAVMAYLARPCSLLSPWA